MKEILHFSHANGFPAKSYRVLFDALGEHYDIRYIDRLAHDPGFPVTDNWPHLLEELTAYFETHYDQPVIAVGHSLGGVLSYMLSRSRPDLVKKVLLLDAPVLDQYGSLVVRLAKRLGWMDYITPAGRTEGRRSFWESTDEAIEYFRHKSLFRNVDERCIRDYVAAGTQPVNEGVQLVFDPDTEVKIYRTLPHDLHRHPGKVTVPGAMMYGLRSNVVRGFQLRHMKKNVGLKIVATQGGHLFPLEHPEQAANNIHETLQAL